VSTSQSISWIDVTREAADHFGYLMALSSSSTRSESATAKYLLSLFEREGIPALILPTIKNEKSGESLYPNLVAHLPGNNSEEPVLFLSHLDTGMSSPADIDLLPVSGSQEVRGPGALTGIVQSASMAMALVLLSRSGQPLRRTVRYAATSHGFGGKAEGLGVLAKNHLEHITSEYAIGWGGISFTSPSGTVCSLVSTSDKGLLKLRIKADNGSGKKYPAERLIAALGRLDEVIFSPVLSEGSRILVESIRENFDIRIPAIFTGNTDTPGSLLSEFENLESANENFPGIISLIRSAICSERTISFINCGDGENRVPEKALAEISFSYPPGENPENIARRILDVVGKEGVYLSEKTIIPPSKSMITPDIRAIIKAATAEVNPAVKVLYGISPSPGGFGPLRRFGTEVYGWEPFIGSGSYEETIEIKGTSREYIEISEFINSVKAMYSFMCRASI
jgi:acetylornithine deacetylase/succinyl-diaminopimelate desuccinylase-like protein